MPRRKLPKLCTHKASGLDYVWLDGRRHYLGKTGDPKTELEYRRVMAEYLSTGLAPRKREEGITVADVFDAYLANQAKEWIGPDGKTARRLFEGEQPLLDAVRAEWGELPAEAFGPTKLRAIRQSLVDRGLKRSTINDRITTIQKVFRVAASLELVPPATYEALRCVTALRKYQVPPEQEPAAVQPAPERHIKKVLPLLPTPVRTLVQLQFHTAARAGELIEMRPRDLDRNRDVWRYLPSHHKTERFDGHGERKVIYLGPESQRLLTPLLEGRDPDDYVFSPAESAEEVFQRRNRNRKTPSSCGNKRGTNRKRKPTRSPGKKYTTDSYRRSIRRACEKAGVPIFTPHQLRHTANARIEGVLGKEHSSAMSGHKDPRVNDRYHKRRQVEKKALEAARRLG